MTTEQRLPTQATNALDGAIDGFGRQRSRRCNEGDTGPRLEGRRFDHQPDRPFVRLPAHDQTLARSDGGTFGATTLIAICSGGASAGAGTIAAAFGRGLPSAMDGRSGSGGTTVVSDGVSRGGPGRVGRSKVRPLDSTDNARFTDGSGACRMAQLLRVRVLSQDHPTPPEARHGR